MDYTFLFIFFLYFGPTAQHVGSNSQPGIKPAHLALEAQSLNGLPGTPLLFVLTESISSQFTERKELVSVVF